jgi:hypothetical protein
MSDHKNQDEDLKAFEAALAALHPRSEVLDRRWRFLLAQEAAFNQTLPESELVTASRSLCARCGGNLLREPRSRRRWAWPTAFSAMTAVAATLLMMMLVRPESQIAVPRNERVSTAPPAPAVEDRAERVAWLATRNGFLRRPISDDSETSYLNLRDQIMLFGVDSWQQPTAAVVKSKAAEPSGNYREQLNRLLRQEGLHGS